MTIVKHIVIAIFAAGFTLVLLLVGAMAWDMAHKETAPVTSISDMLAEAQTGHVEQITVRGARYEYRFRGTEMTKVAYGPKTTAAELAPLVGSTKIDVK